MNYLYLITCLYFCFFIVFSDSHGVGNKLAFKVIPLVLAIFFALLSLKGFNLL